jgi:biofilm PGA synthesis N-glycosyltransferase PgaC
LRLKHLGHDIIAPVECATVTDIMPTWGKLYKQRLRWRKGFMDNLKAFGITKHTWEYWLRQIFAVMGICVTAIYLASLVYALIFVQHLVMHPLFIGVTVIFMIERMVTIKKRGFLTTLIAGVMIVELVYELFLQATYGIAYVKSAFNAKGEW